MNERKRVFTGAPWEPVVGYCRAIRSGNTIEVSGTVAIENGQAVAPGDAAAQTDFILTRIKNAIEELGGRLDHVVRTRIFVTDMSQWQAVGETHGRYFRDICPVSSMMEVSGLINPDCVVEIEARAILDD